MTEIVTAVKSDEGSGWIGIVKVDGNVVWTVVRATEQQALNAAKNREPR